MNYIDDYNNLPDEIKSKLSKANIWYQRSVYDYFHQKNQEIVYFFDETYILIGFLKKKFIFKYLYLHTEPYCYNQNYNEHQQTFLDEIAILTKEKLSIDFIAQTSVSALFEDAPSESISIPFGSHIIDLTQSEEELWAKLHSKHRNVIRNAEKHDVKVVMGGLELLDDYLLAENDTCKRSHLSSVGKEFYAELFEEFKNNVIIFLAYQKNILQGGAIFYYNNAMAYYMHGASINEVTTGAINLLLWESIKYFKSINVRQFSFVGARINEDENSKYHGIQNFKKRFGGELFVGKMFKVINKPWKYKVYKLLLIIKNKKLSNKDVIDQEIHKWQGK